MPLTAWKEKSWVNSNGLGQVPGFCYSWFGEFFELKLFQLTVINFYPFHLVQMQLPCLSLQFAVISSVEMPKADLWVIFAVLSTVIGYCAKTYFTLSVSFSLSLVAFLSFWIQFVSACIIYFRMTSVSHWLWVWLNVHPLRKWFCNKLTETSDFFLSHCTMFHCGYSSLPLVILFCCLIIIATVCLGRFWW